MNLPQVSICTSLLLGCASPSSPTAASADSSGEDVVSFGECGPTHDRVTRVLDGDTVEISSGYKVRFLLIDTPEIAHNTHEVAECFGDAARDFTSSKVLGRWVELEYDAVCTDKYDRLLAYIVVNDGAETFNETLVSRGFATVMYIPPNGKTRVSAYRALEADAQNRGAGGHGSCVNFNQ